MTTDEEVLKAIDHGHAVKDTYKEFLEHAMPASTYGGTAERAARGVYLAGASDMLLHCIAILNRASGDPQLGWERLRSLSDEISSMGEQLRAETLAVNPQVSKVQQ